MRFLDAGETMRRWQWRLTKKAQDSYIQKNVYNKDLFMASEGVGCNAQDVVLAHET